MKKSLLCALLCLFLVSVAFARPPREFNTTVSATQANTETSFGFEAADVLIINDGADEIYLTFTDAAATTDDFSLNSGEKMSIRFTDPSRKPAEVNIICAAGETASVRVVAWKN